MIDAFSVVGILGSSGNIVSFSTYYFAWINDLRHVRARTHRYVYCRCIRHFVWRIFYDVHYNNNNDDTIPYSYIYIIYHNRISSAHTKN